MTDIGTSQYWNDRYMEGGNSGFGSYGRLADFKAETLNGFIAAHGISSMAELGCGDGNQLGLVRVGRYSGYDISPKAVEICADKYRHDPTKSFHVYDPLGPPLAQTEQAELAVSLDVVYHLLEDDTYEAYMRDLFRLAGRFVAVYSNNTEKTEDYSQHIRCHKFTGWVERNLTEWVLCGYVPNPYPPDPIAALETSSADFYFFSRGEAVAPKYSCLFEGLKGAGAPGSSFHATVMFTAARQSIADGDLRKAAFSMRLAAGDPGARVLALANLGALLAAQGQHREAEDALKAALARDPRHKNARTNIAILYLRLQRWEDLNPYCPELREMRVTRPDVDRQWPQLVENVRNLQ
ncbi:MAG: tetratricopeptide repeat protein [Deltaproteobacteria bacterium]|nr:tetratricopeptide repeat protein [Deltaproteobacteria bacterium]